MEDEAQRVFEKEVPSDWIGTQVMRRLREMDHVAYVRFASVYREFSTVDDLMTEIREVVAQRADDPAQASLFDAAARARLKKPANAKK